MPADWSWPVALPVGDVQVSLFDPVPFVHFLAVTAAETHNYDKVHMVFQASLEQNVPVSKYAFTKFIHNYNYFNHANIESNNIN